MNIWRNMLRVLKVYRGGGIGKENAEGRKLLEFCDERQLCVANTWFYKTEKKKITLALVDGKQIDFVLVEKNTESMQRI